MKYTINCLIMFFHSFIIRCSTDIVTSIRDVRKTSNGCQVAKCIPRKKSGFRVHSGNIAAIDFGTTNCSVAYTTVGSGTEEDPRLLPLNSTYYRVPTAILFKPDGSIDSFGYDARAEYLNLANEDRLDYAYFEQIKMNLQHDKVCIIRYTHPAARIILPSTHRRM